MEIFLNSYVTGIGQIPRSDNRRVLLTIISRVSDSSYHCTVSPFLIKSSPHSHSVCVFHERGSKRREVERLRFKLCLLGFQNLPHRKSSLCLGSLFPWLQAQLQVSFPCGFRSRDPENNFEATAPLRCRKSGAPPWPLNICKTLLSFLPV